jgi:hypothetical protein
VAKACHHGSADLPPSTSRQSIRRQPSFPAVTTSPMPTPGRMPSAPSASTPGASAR